MTTGDTGLSATLDDTEALRQAMDDLDARSRSFGAALSASLRQATVGGKGLEDVLKSLGTRLSDIALSAGLKPLENLFAGTVSGLLGSLGAAGTSSGGGASGGVTAFADGGVVSQPTYFSMGGGTGLMGEAGTEAILPLKRGSDGALGVATASAPASQITFHVTATDAASFARSESQIAAMLARTVQRGQRSL